MHKTALTEGAEHVIQNSTQEVLETMFFAIVEEEENDEDAGAYIGARVAFEGTWHGWTEVRLSRLASDTICRDFLGLGFDEEVDEQQREHVVGEMANMICGAALSRLEPDGTFDLQTPEALPDGAAGQSPQDGVRVVLPLEIGHLEVCLAAA